MKRLVFICLILLVAIPMCGQPKRRMARTLKETFAKGAGVYKGYKGPSPISTRGRILFANSLGYEVPFIGDSILLLNNPVLLMGDQLKIDAPMSFILEDIHKYDEQYKAQTDSINNLVRETIEENGCDSCLLHVYFLQDFTNVFYVHQSREATNVNMTSTDSLDVYSTYYTGVYGHWPNPEPLYGINVECYRNDEPVPKTILEELTDKVARFLELSKFVMEMPHYKLPMLTVPSNLLNNTPKQ